MLWGCRGDIRDATSIDLGASIPEECMMNEVAPILHKLNQVVNKYDVYIWSTTGHRYTNTDNEV